MYPKRLLLLLTALLSLNLSAKESYKEDIFNDYISGNMPQWEGVIAEMEQQLPHTTHNQLTILGYYYGLMGHYLNVKENGKAEVILKKAVKLSQEIAKESPNNPLQLGYAANIDGFKIALHPYKAPFLVKDMLGNAKQSIKLEANDPVVNVLYANILFYMPPVFGGDESLSLQHYEKALHLMEQQPAFTQENWLYIQLITTIGLVYEKMGKYSEAEKWFDKVLQLQPNYKRMEQVILPKLMRDIKKGDR